MISLNEETATYATFWDSLSDTKILKYFSLSKTDLPDHFTSLSNNHTLHARAHSDTVFFAYSHLKLQTSKMWRRVVWRICTEGSETTSSIYPKNRDSRFVRDASIFLPQYKRFSHPKPSISPSSHPSSGKSQTSNLVHCFSFDDYFFSNKQQLLPFKLHWTENEHNAKSVHAIRCRQQNG